MGERHAGLDQVVPPAAVLGYLNFSTGKPDPRFAKNVNDLYAWLAVSGVPDPWLELPRALLAELDPLAQSGASAFRDPGQARAVLEVLFPAALAAYRRHHTDLLAHLDDRALFQPFFLARVFEAILAQGGPWNATDRIVSGALARLNDFVGYRPVATVEARAQEEVYDHEKVRPIPLYIRGAGVAVGRHRDLVAKALEILGGADPALLADAGFDPDLLDELALDPRAYDQGHPANRRPNYVFGEWDPHHLDGQGRYRRFVVRDVTLDALLARVESGSVNPRLAELDPAEALSEAAAVLAGTILMASAVTGNSPTAHDSTATLGRLMPAIARCRDAFYAALLERVSGPHGERLRAEAARLRQPFAGARRHLNEQLARHRALQMQQRHLALLFTALGYPDAARDEAARIQPASVRMLAAIAARLSQGRLRAEAGDLAAAGALLPEVEDLLDRGIRCGALADPWNVLGFQGLFPLSPAQEDSVRDTRVDDLVYAVQQAFDLYTRLLSDAASAGQPGLVAELTPRFARLAAWWDRFATAAVADVRPVHGGEAVESARHVATALGRWHERGGTADLAFWKAHMEGFRSPKAFALVIDAILRKRDYRAAMALLVAWLGQAEQVPLEDGAFSFHALAIRLMIELGNAGPDAAGLVRRFFDHLEANAEDYGQVPSLASVEELGPPREADELYGAAYEGVTFRDSADDDQEGEVAGGPTPAREFLLEAEAEGVAKRLRFLATLARLWHLAANRRTPGAGPAAEDLRCWLAAAEQNRQRLLALMDAVHATAVPEPGGSYDSLVEYDRRRWVKVHLLEAVVGTCLDTTLAAGALRGASGTDAPGDRPAWEAAAIRLGRALGQADADGVRRTLAEFLEPFRAEPLLAPALAEDGDPRQALRARLAQSVVRALAASLPRLGFLRETCDLLRTARAMERTHPTPGRGVSEFNTLFQAGYQAAVESVVASAAAWAPAPGGDQELTGLLERLTVPFLRLWIEHSQTILLSPLEVVRQPDDWSTVEAFVRRYGGDLFGAQFMTVGNLRGILQSGVPAFLDRLRDEPDPLHPVRLAEDLDEKIPKGEAARFLQFVLQAVVENYEEYKDYKASLAQSDYGQNLYILLDFLRLKAVYERHAWQFRPLMWAHEVLARQGRPSAAVAWQAAFAAFTRGAADQGLQELARLEQVHGAHVSTVADRLRERFVRPLAVDRLCALVAPAMREARVQTGGSHPPPAGAFDRLRTDLAELTREPAGVGLDVPAWLTRLEQEVHRASAAESPLAAAAETLPQVPRQPLTRESLLRQLDALDQAPPS